MSVGSRIKELREERQLTRNALAKILGVTVGAISNYENEVSSPKEPILFKLIETLSCDANYLFQDAIKMSEIKNDVTYPELQHIKKYRDLDDRGRETVSYILDRESERVEQLTNARREKSTAIIDIQPRTDTNRLVEYFHSASAGAGVFIMGNEATEQIAIPNTKKNRTIDYAIKVSGDSMSPDYLDGDTVFVSQKAELHYGDVGIFVINNNAYIKEYGEDELVSRNPESENITIAEHDNIVCMGKVVGKVEEIQA